MSVLERVRERSKRSSLTFTLHRARQTVAYVTCYTLHLTQVSLSLYNYMYNVMYMYMASNRVRCKCGRRKYTSIGRRKCTTMRSNRVRC